MQSQEEVIMIKGKRTKRPRLSPAMASAGSSEYDVVSGISDRATPSPSNSGDLTQSSAEVEEEDMANCLILLAKGSSQPPHIAAAAPLVAAAAAETYQCKTCSKSFLSFQALGGHRASHKKPNNNKSISAVDDKKQDEIRFQSNGRDDDGTIVTFHVSNKSRVHECSICGAEFASGQALGGHMRRHRPIPASGSAGEGQGFNRPRNIFSIDLNLPAPEEDEQMDHDKFQFPAKLIAIIS